MSKGKRRARVPLTDAEWDDLTKRLEAGIERAMAAGKLVGELETEYLEAAEKVFAELLRPLGREQRIELLERLYEQESK